MPDRMYLRPLSKPKGPKLNSYRFKMPRSRGLKSSGKVRFLKSRVGK